MEDLQTILCGIKFQSRKIAEHSVVAYWQRGSDRLYHIREILEEYKKLCLEVEKMKGHIDTVVD